MKTIKPMTEKQKAEYDQSIAGQYDKMFTERADKIREFAKTEGPEDELLSFSKPFLFISRSEAKNMASFNYKHLDLMRKSFAGYDENGKLK